MLYLVLTFNKMLTMNAYIGTLTIGYYSGKDTLFSKKKAPTPQHGAHTDFVRIAVYFVLISASPGIIVAYLYPIVHFILFYFSHHRNSQSFVSLTCIKTPKCPLVSPL